MTSLLDESDPKREPDLEPEESAEAADPEPAPARRAQPGAGRGRRRRRGPSRSSRVMTGLAAGVLAVGLGAAAWSVPPVHTMLLESFTEQQQPYAELYFAGTPAFEGATVVVPVAVTDHGEGAKGYQLKVTLESPDGKAVNTTTVNLAARYNAPVSTVVRLQAKSDVALVRVDMVGHPQTLHFRFGKPQAPDH